MESIPNTIIDELKIQLLLSSPKAFQDRKYLNVIQNVDLILESSVLKIIANSMIILPQTTESYLFKASNCLIFTMRVSGPH